MICKTCDYSYIGQTGSSLTIRCRELVRYFNTNNQNSAYALRILNSRLEYTSMEEPWSC